MELAGLVKTFEHGTRARYTRGCRCRACKDSNVRRYHEQQRAAKEAAAALSHPPIPIQKPWRAPDGTIRTRTYQGCPGPDGTGCPHGRHLRHDSTGVCDRCRLRLVYNGLVPADKARHHLRMLSKWGVGRRTVSDAAGVSRTVLDKIRSGKKRTIRAETERRILEVDAGAIADGALVDAAPVWRTIHHLVRDHGFTKTEIARRIGQNGPLQLGQKKVTVRNAFKIEKLRRDADGDFLDYGR